ncbi:hypothetical protein DT603_04850 [Pseudoxanthomonas gei]|uniref:GNAT family N-acetyltransferase n=1 Tax=Pseudoxanthomonas gei TaxID=1383030 RepID=A0ABX0AC24_9GAMM|nr:hypothetical protein [Pseudoxanthomonas gei]NDK38167.1 hypothetical protein [Pseudoxanthomonas gei]
MLKMLRHWLRRSSHVHVRQAGPTDLQELVGLLDRFLDDKPRYPLEWDDFISWESHIPAIESIRIRVEATEPLFISRNAEDLAKGSALVLEERNRVAAWVGQPAPVNRTQSSG